MHFSWQKQIHTIFGLEKFHVRAQLVNIDVDSEIILK
jgi:hypothetical protein